jgi:hypothetical protein
VDTRYLGKRRRDKMKLPDISKPVDWIENEIRNQMTVREINEQLEKKGIENIEITFHKKKYHVLRILKNNVPVPLMITEDKTEMIDYLKHILKTGE